MKARSLETDWKFPETNSWDVAFLSRKGYIQFVHFSHRKYFVILVMMDVQAKKKRNEI